MSIILNHKHDGEIQFELDRVNYLARTRTVNIDDVYSAIATLDQKFESCTKRSRGGLVVRVDMNSRHFPNAYRGISMSTHFTLVYEKRSWRFVCAERLRCGESKRYDVTLTDAMRDELLKRFESFDR